jgi:hypothetical protein
MSRFTAVLGQQPARLLQQRRRQILLAVRPAETVQRRLYVRPGCRPLPLFLMQNAEEAYAFGSAVFVIQISVDGQYLFKIRLGQGQPL